jgi:hypothetical protein
MDADGKPLSVRGLPGLRAEVLKTLESAFPGIITPALRKLLATCSGLADTALGHIDFTGCCFPEEPCTVFQPCLTIAVDDSGRRWIAEVRDKGLPGPVWCVFPSPEVAVHVSDDLQAFVAMLHEQAHRGRTLEWLKDLTATAHAIWTQRRTLALRPYSIYRSDAEIRGWLSRLPTDAYVYDLRDRSAVRGWPYGVAGPSGRLYRCARLPVFAVAASPTEGWRSRHPDTTSPVYPVAALGLQIGERNALTSRRRRRLRGAGATRLGSRASSNARTAQSSAQCRSGPRIVAAAFR